MYVYKKHSWHSRLQNQDGKEVNGKKRTSFYLLDKGQYFQYRFSGHMPLDYQSHPIKLLQNGE